MPPYKTAQMLTNYPSHGIGCRHRQLLFRACSSNGRYYEQYPNPGHNHRSGSLELRKFYSFISITQLVDRLTR